MTSLRKQWEILDHRETRQIIYHQGGTNLKNMENLKLREFENLSKSQGELRENWNFCRKTWKTQGKCKVCEIIANENVFRIIFLS